MPLPRAVQIGSGLVLLGWAGLSLAGSFALLWMEPRRNWLLTKTIAALLLFGSLWVIVKALALIRGPSSSSSPLLSLGVIRGFAVAFASLPVIAMVLGTTTIWAGLLGFISYFWIAYTIFRSTAAPADDITAEDEPKSNGDDDEH